MIASTSHGRPYAEVIGDPIAQSKSPLIHNFWLGKLGINAEYKPCHVRPEELADYFARRRADADWRGCNVTIPHKVAAISHIDDLDASARTVGAVNTVTMRNRLLMGANTDLDGIKDAIQPALHLDRDRYCVLVDLIGAGGASRAALVALKQLELDEVTVLARDEAKAAALCDELGLGSAFGYSAPLSALLEPNAALDDDFAKLIINASPLGMNGYPPLNINLENLPSDTVVFDMVYSPLETSLLREARARGMIAVDGLVMLIGQAAVAFEKFFGQPAPREHDAELRALLTA